MSLRALDLDMLDVEWVERFFFSSLISCIGEGIRHVDEKVVDIASSTALVAELELCSVLDG
jgi:hypothetical protein